MELRKLTRTATSLPYTTIAIALRLVIRGSVEARETIKQDFSETEFGAQSSAFLLSLVSLIGDIPDNIERPV